MTRLHRILTLVVFSLLSAASTLFAQSPKEYKYSSVPGDPLQTRIYKLDNGLTVYMSVYKDAPRIQTNIAVRAGSKNDPADATGLAHYLEHMLFKGTDKFGSLDYPKEKVELDKIENLYETYRSTKDTLLRRKIYHQIDSVSGVAAKFAIANEYDKMLAQIGAKGTNAYTSEEQTVYVNDIPANQFEKWVTIEAERFRNPQLRLFHTEIEAVYEEKNRNLDDDGTKTWEAMSAALFKKHPYGTQTTIGTIDHLKNPSLKKIREYYNANYIPNNMAICLSGDLNPDEAIRIIDTKFGNLPSKPLPKFVSPVEDPITSPVVVNVYGPDAESMLLAYRLPGVGTKEADLMEMADMVLCNGNAGLLDLNLNQKQKVLSSGTYPIVQKDYSVYLLYGNPRTGQKIEDVKTLLLEQIGKLQKGDFPDWLMKAAITDLKLRETHTLESNGGRANEFVSAFILGEDWKLHMNKIDRLSQITKQQIMDFAKTYYTTNNYVVVYKRTGEDKNVQKVVKPGITPVEVNREAKSPFLSSIVNTKAEDIKPVFVDYRSSIKSMTLGGRVGVNYLKNTENKLFNLVYLVEMGKNNSKKMSLAINYLKYLGTSKFTSEQIQEEFYKLGCSFNVSSSDEQTYVELTGLSENIESSLQLFESLLSDAQPNPEALTNMVSDILKGRADAKLEKNTILWTAMYSYAQYGPKSPFTNILSEAELKTIQANDLVELIKKITSYNHRILYYGPNEAEQVMAILEKNHKLAAGFLTIPKAIDFPEKATNDSMVYIVNYDMKQAEIIMVSKGTKYDKSLIPSIRMYNSYFGGSMASIVFQEMRESKALAYSVFAGFNAPARAEKSFYNFAYVGTQADKMPEALVGMNALLSDMPQSPALFASAKESIKNVIETERITKMGILWSFERAKKLGLDYDIRKDVYEKIPSMTIQDINTFQAKYVKGQPYTYMVLGDVKNLDMKSLSKYGKTQTLTLDEVFGY